MAVNVKEVIETTKRLEPEHWAQLCEAKSDDGKAGSYYPGSSPLDVAELVEQASWEPYSHVSIREPATGFICSIGGHVNVVPIVALRDDVLIHLVDAHFGVNLDDEHFAEAEAGIDAGVEVSWHSTMLIGPRTPLDPTLIVWTFHPGDPVRCSSLPAEQWHGKTISKQQALEAGLSYAKVRR